ncbi:MAG: hypothetical protein ACD_12C00523G0004 [uncultured bacterium]|nr:MAG: hypothetical protein ACD_12C00523G0004 [uncultured bacterium]
MDDSNKFLKIVFFVLLIITVGELFYFFVYKSSILNKKTTILPSPINNSGKIPDDSLVINRDQIKYLSTLKKIDVDQLKSFYSTGAIGIVSNLKKFSDTQISFDLTDENGKKSLNIRFPIIKDIPFSVYQSDNDVITRVNIGNVSEGDKIKFLWIYDLSKQPGKMDIYNNELIIYKDKNEKIY